MADTSYVPGCSQTTDSTPSTSFTPSLEEDNHGGGID